MGLISDFVRYQSFGFSCRFTFGHPLGPFFANQDLGLYIDCLCRAFPIGGDIFILLENKHLFLKRFPVKKTC